MRKKLKALLNGSVSFRDFDGRTVTLPAGTELMVYCADAELSTDSTGKTVESTQESWHGLAKGCDFDLARYEFSILQ